MSPVPSVEDDQDDHIDCKNQISDPDLEEEDSGEEIDSSTDPPCTTTAITLLENEDDQENPQSQHLLNDHGNFSC